ncbi:MAG: GlsB/YeaQ/YmgE family stress response membrane protein [Chloroflexi bacterium]|nr:GlsB/YeaQ/YmgE family stress response membrane protein [Chloroflexota bacterium]
MGTLIGLLGALVVTIIIVAIVETVSRTKLPYGWLGNIVVGFIGGIIGQLVLGTWGPYIFGVYVIQTFLGALVFILVAKWVMGMMAKSR